MKILILVLSASQHPYDKFMEAQQKTWDSVAHSNVDTVYFLHGTPGLVGNICFTNANDAYFSMHCKMREAMEQIDISKYDFVFRTNSSSYVIKSRLYDLCLTLPKENLYGGAELGGADWAKVNFQGVEVPQHCASGAGIFMSRDVAICLRDNIPCDIEMEDDVLIGRLLASHGFGFSYLNNSRVDLAGLLKYNPDAWHYRMKSPNRLKDIQLMYKLHNKIYGT